VTGCSNSKGRRASSPVRFEKFTKIIQASLAGERPIPDDAASGDDGGTTDAGDNGTGSDTKIAASTPPAPAVDLKDIFEMTDTGVQILRPVPGSSKAQKALNGAKLYLYGLQALKQRDTALFAEIKRVCKAHGCYDSANMAACLKADRTSFVFGGRGKRQTLKLSAPGPACDRGADCSYQDPRTWNRAETEGKRTPYRHDSAARHGILAPQHGNARQIAPIRVSERRSRWLLGPAAWNKQADRSVSPRIV